MKMKMKMKKMIQLSIHITIIYTAVLLTVSNAASPHFSKNIVVGHSGNRDYSKIQDAIDKGVPESNSQWIHIYVQPGFYYEKINIPITKPFIALQGSGTRDTIIAYGGDEDIWDATITVAADNFVAKGITFKNTHNRTPQDLVENNGGERVPAVAGFLTGDKNAFYQCGFIGLQDTLYDALGRHYFNGCYIEGFVDFIFGNGQSVYEFTAISLVPMLVDSGTIGYITAHKRESEDESTGFVFKYCTVSGNGTAFLGRAWGDYSRVIFYNSNFGDFVVPEGWDAWFGKGREDRLTYAEVNCFGKSANTSRRVKWQRKLSSKDAGYFIGRMFNNADGWIENQPLR